MSAYKEFVSEELQNNRFISFIQYSEKPKKIVEEHWHDYYELLYVIDGSAKQVIDDELFLLKQGDTLLISPKSIHSTISIEDHCSIAAVLFFSESTLTSTHLKYPYKCFMQIKDIISQINAEYHEKMCGYEFLMLGYIQQIIGYILREQNENIFTTMKPSENKIMEICTYIEFNITENISLNCVAKRFGYSPTYFSKYFKESVGIPFKSYTDKIKVMYAKKLLLFENSSITQVAEILHYENSSSFSRAFKRIYGISPSSFLTNRNLKS